MSQAATDCWTMESGVSTQARVVPACPCLGPCLAFPRGVRWAGLLSRDGGCDELLDVVGGVRVRASNCSMRSANFYFNSLFTLLFTPLSRRPSIAILDQRHTGVSIYRKGAFLWHGSLIHHTPRFSFRPSIS